jgi:hypothetical protein
VRGPKESRPSYNPSVQLPEIKVVRSPRFVASLIRLDGECAEPQLRDLEWKITRGYSPKNFEEFLTRSGKIAYVARTMGLGDCPPLRIFMLVEGATVALADVALAQSGSSDN